MEPLKIFMSQENVIYGGLLTPLFRGEVVALNGEVVDRTCLFDTEKRAHDEAQILLKLYQEKQQTREIRIGFTSHEGMELLKSGSAKTWVLYKEATGAYVVPVYVKQNDAWATQGA